jgi:hypothetical protein
MRIACFIPKTTNTHSEYVYLLLFRYNNGYTKAPECYIICISPVLFVLTEVFATNLPSIWKVGYHLRYFSELEQSEQLGLTGTADWGLIVAGIGKFSVLQSFRAFSAVLLPFYPMGSFRGSIGRGVKPTTLLLCDEICLPCTIRLNIVVLNKTQRQLYLAVCCILLKLKKICDFGRLVND